MFIKKVDGTIEAAPYKYENDGIVFIGYNLPGNRDMLLRDGYIEYTGNNPLEYLDIVNGEVVELQYPPIDEIRDSLSNSLYEMKKEVAYTGIIVIFNQTQYQFDTDMDSITMTNSIIMSASDEQEISWKVYIENTPSSILITIAQLKLIFYYGMRMINEAFEIESKYNKLISEMSDSDIANNTITDQLLHNARTEFDGINKVFSLDPETNESNTQVESNEG